jgi:hypothetical protein
MTNKYVKTDVEGFVKDPNNGAVLSVDYVGLDAYRKQKQNALKAERANIRLDSVEKDLGEIKQMLQQLLQR